MNIRTLLGVLCALFAISLNCQAEESANKAGRCPITENQLIGYWKGADNGFFEEFLISRDGSEQRFSSWRHHRPDVNGMWVFEKCELKISGPMEFHFRILAYKGGKLTLRDVDEGTTAAYLRSGKQETP